MRAGAALHARVRVRVRVPPATLRPTPPRGEHTDTATDLARWSPAAGSSSRESVAAAEGAATRGRRRRPRRRPARHRHERRDCQPCRHARNSRHKERANTRTKIVRTIWFVCSRSFRQRQSCRLPRRRQSTAQGGMWQSSQKSSTGLISQKMRDVDSAAPRARLPPRALPDSVRRQMRLPPREGAPSARRNWETPQEMTTKEALFGENANRVQMQQRPAEKEARPDDRGGRARRVSAIPVEVSRVPKNLQRAQRGPTRKAPSPYDTELQGGLRRMQMIP